MPSGLTDIVVQLKSLRPGDYRLVAEISFGLDTRYPATFSPAQPHSYLSFGVLSDLQIRTRASLPKLIDDLGGGSYVVHEAKLVEAPVPDFRVRVSRIADMLGRGVILGYDFLEHFTEVRLEPSSRRVTLVDP